MTLTLDVLPSPEASLEELSAFALSFPGYAWGGGGPKELSDKLEALCAAHGGNCTIEQLVADGKISTDEAIPWIRADLFLEQRSVRWCDGDWVFFRKNAQDTVNLLRGWLEGRD